jgi:hypothetical protein
MKLIMKGGDPFQENKKSESIFSELKMCSFEELSTQLNSENKEPYTIFQERKTEAANCILDYELLVEKCEEDNGKRVVTGSATIWKNRKKKVVSYQIKYQVNAVYNKNHKGLSEEQKLGNGNFEQVQF